jgi:hypothetical protein
MIEIELIKKLVEAHTLWVTPPYYTNDAQNVIMQAVNLAVDTEWEKQLQEILEPDNPIPPLEKLEEQFLARNSQYTKDDIQDYNNTHNSANSEYHAYLQSIGEAEKQRIVGMMEYMTHKLGESVSDKVHRRNIQIADLKKQLPGQSPRGLNSIDSKLGKIEKKRESKFS